MKTNIILLIAILIFAINTACKKDKDIVNIIYPIYGDYGVNILQVDSIDIKSSNDYNQYYYSCRAELHSGTNLKIIFKNKSIGDGHWSFSPSSRIGWSIGPYDIPPGSRQFFAYGPVICDVAILFTFSGLAEIEVYENKDTIPTRIKTIYW